MTAIPAEMFLSWAVGLRVVPDKRYAAPRSLVYLDDRSDSRFWTLPIQREDILAFLSHALLGLEPWNSCYVWPRGGCWHNPDPPRNRIEEERRLALYGGHIPEGLLGALRYSAGEAEQLLNLIGARTRTAFCASDDLFIAPDHATAFLHLDHHDVIHVECRDAARMKRFIHHMSSGGYALPSELSDETFKRPGWMN